MSATKAFPSLTLFRGFRVSNEFVWSPFSNKLEARLRFGNVHYEKDIGAPPKAPRGKVPYIAYATSENATPETMGDTALIISRLVDDGVLTDLNARLSPELLAQDLALRALLEDKLYFYQVYERWHENYYTMRDGVLGTIPYPMRVLVGLVAYRKVSGTLYGQGTMRYDPEEIHAFRRQIWETFDGLLVVSRKKQQQQLKASDGDTPFWVLGGSEPTEADPALFGFIMSTCMCTAGPDSQKLVKSFPAVMDYAGRIYRRYFPDYESFA